ncbi:MAG: hypothetical protein VB135_00205 [Burkholderia sp.]
MTMKADSEVTSGGRYFLRADGQSGDVVVFGASKVALARVDAVAAAMSDLGLRSVELEEPGLQAIFISAAKLEKFGEVSGWDEDLLSGASAIAYSDDTDYVAELSGAGVEDGFARLMEAWVVCGQSIDPSGEGIELATVARITPQGEVIHEWWRDGSAPGEHSVCSSELPHREDLVPQDVSSPTQRAAHSP